ncbi:hypothetical protein BsWGS_28074 [Bradybaena similaris]
MYTHTLLALLVLYTSISAFTCCPTLPDRNQLSDEILADPYVRFAVKAIHESFAKAGDNRERVLQRITSQPIQSPNGTICRIQIGVSGGNTRELCTVSVQSGPGRELQASQFVEKPLCEELYRLNTSTNAHIPRSQAPCFKRYCDREFAGAVDFLEQEITVQTNSSRYLGFIFSMHYFKEALCLHDLSTRDVYVVKERRPREPQVTGSQYYTATSPAYDEIFVDQCQAQPIPVSQPRTNMGGLITLYDLEFIKTPCTLAAYMNETRDYWGVCTHDEFSREPPVVKCPFLEVIYNKLYDPQYKLVRYSCIKTEFFP